jgi:hypothetical protein
MNRQSSIVGGCVHFIGFRGDEYWSAARIWGKPDYIWEQATWHILGEIAPEDTVIFGPKAFNKGRYHRNGLQFPHAVAAGKARVS